MCSHSSCSLSPLYLPSLTGPHFQQTDVQLECFTSYESWLHLVDCWNTKCMNASLHRKITFKRPELVSKQLEPLPLTKIITVFWNFMNSEYLLKLPSGIQRAAEITSALIWQCLRLVRADLGRGHVIPSAVHNLYLLIISSTFADINRSSGPEVALLHQQTDSFIRDSILTWPGCLCCILQKHFTCRLFDLPIAYFLVIYASFLDVDGSS